MTVRATWNGTVLAESDGTVVVEGNHYFPPDDVRPEYFEASDTHTMCPWKGRPATGRWWWTASRNEDAAWYYPTPKDAAKEITDRVAFWQRRRRSKRSPDRPG